MKLKELFNKHIECGNEINDHIVFPFKKKKWLYLNKNIFVREKNAAVIVYKHRVCDVVFEGKYRLNQDSISETYDRAKVARQNKKGAKVRRIRADIYFVNLNEFKNFEFQSDIPFKVKSGSMGKVQGYLRGLCTVKVIDAGSLIRALITDTGKAKLEEIPQDIGLWIGNKINHLINKNKIPVTQVLSEQEYVESVVNGEMQNALDKIGLFVTNVKLKAVDFPKKFKGRVNSYMSTHKRRVKNFEINSALPQSANPTLKIPVVTTVQTQTNYGAMQNIQKSSNIPSFIVCGVCKKHNSIDAKICINCGNKLS